VLVRDTLYGVGDNTTSKQLRKAFDAQAFAWFAGTYHNFLAIYSSSSRHLERRAAANIDNLRNRRSQPVPFFPSVLLSSFPSNRPRCARGGVSCTLNTSGCFKTVHGSWTG
jgi:hypothetical protein